MAYVGGGAPSGPANIGRLPGDRPNDAPGGGVVGAKPTLDPSQQFAQNMYNQWYSGYMAPSLMYGQAQVDQLQNQIGLTGMQTGLQSDVAKQQAGFQQQALGLQGQELDVQKGALARQMAELPQQYGLQQQEFGIQGQRLDIQGKQIDLSQLGAWQNAAQQQRALKGQATSSGTWNMPGTSQGFADIKNALQNQMTGFGLQRQGLDLSRQDLGINKQKAALDYYEKTAAGGDSQKMLDIQSKRLGLSGDEIKSRLQNQLDQLGISNQVSVDQLLGEQYKVQQGELSPMSQLFSGIYQGAGIGVPAG